MQSVEPPINGRFAGGLWADRVTYDVDPDHAARKAVPVAAAGKPIVFRPSDSCRELICSKPPAGAL